MSVSRSQRYVYFQNKANHYFKLRNIRSSIDHSPPRSNIPKPKVYRPIPLLQQHSIQVQNQLLIERLTKIAASDRIQVAADGSYSRYNREVRPFRELSPYRDEKQRAITIDNSDRRNRITSIKPAIGTTNQWNKDYLKSVYNKKNACKYLENHKSKASLKMCNQQFIPQHLRDFWMRDNLNASVGVKQTNIPMEKLFQLPAIVNSNPSQLSL